jgi:hypothetical protein
MRLRFHAQTLVALALLGTLLACGGAYTPPPGQTTTTTPHTAATALAYTDPVSTGWRLVKDTASTPTRLVLKLIGPNGAMARGVGFNLASDGSLPFHQFNPGTAQCYLQDTGVFYLKRDPATSVFGPDGRYSWMHEPVIAVGGVKNGGKLLTVGIYQKDRAVPAQAVDASGGVVRIGLDLPTTNIPAAGSLIPLTVVRARIIPADIAPFPAEGGDWRPVMDTWRMDDIQIAVGTLRAQ